MSSSGLADDPLSLAATSGTLVRVFPTLMGLAMCISCVVLIEPAPVDALIFGLFVLGLAFGVIRIGRLPVLPVLFLSGLALTNVIGIPLSEDPERAIWYCLVTLYMMISWALFVGAIEFYGQSILKPLMQGYVLGAIPSVILAGASYFHLIGFQFHLLLNGRPKGLFKDPNVFGPYLILIALLGIAGCLPFSSRAAQMTVAFIASLGVVLSYSRACWINYAISFSVFVFLDRFLPSRPKAHHFPSLLRLLGSGLLAIFVIASILQVPVVKTMIATRLGQGGMQAYDDLRFETQRLAVQAAIEHPLGIGPGQSEETFQYATHSSYLRVLSENGLLGLFCFSGFLISTLLNAIIRAGSATSMLWRGIYIAAAACVCGHLVNSGVVDTLHWRHLWFLFALAWIPDPSSLKHTLFRPGLQSCGNATI